MTEYLEHLRVTPSARGRLRRESTNKLDTWRLQAFLRIGEDTKALSSLTPAAAKRLLEQRQAEVKPDTLAGELSVAQRWGAWVAQQGWLPVNPLAGLVATGERSTGKPQLRVDSARKFLETALADPSDVGTAAAIALLMGLRASEITSLKARDVDNGGTLLWVSVSKTRKGLRQLSVPAVLVPRLVALARGKGSDQSLWGNVDRHWLSRAVIRLAETAGVDRVTPHGLRGTWATLAVGSVPTEHVAAALGHTRMNVTRESYLAPGAEQSAMSSRLGDLLDRRLPAGSQATQDHPLNEPN